MTTPSRSIAAKALSLPVAYSGDSTWIVGSGSVPGKTYIVADNDGVFLCQCVGVIGCSHAYAARAHADPAVRRQLRALVRGPRRMSRGAAMTLVGRYDDAWCEEWQRDNADDGPGYIRARRHRLSIAERIVARLTGHADADAGDE